MPVYGAYETSEEYHRSSRTTVWKARAVSGPGEGVFAVKVCNASEWAEDPAAAEAETQAFAEVGADLQKMSSASSRHWVTVHALSTQPGEAWFVTRFYPRSLERVLEGRIPIDSQTLHSLISSIVLGLKELDQVLQRSHGNLKPANIFIDNDGQLRGAPLLLSDLKPGRELDRAADFQALGKIMVQLVRRRRSDLNAVVGWPLEPGGEWKRLGRHGEAWRKFCNRLLNPAPKPEDLDWAAVEAALRPLAGGGPKPWTLILAAGVPLCALIGAGFYLRLAPYDNVPDRFKDWAEKLGNTPPDTATVPPEWALLCGAYYEWLGGFLAVAGDPGKSAAWRGDPYLNEKLIAVIADAEERNGSFDPRRFDPRIAGSLASLQSNPPDVAKKGTVVRKVLDAYKTVLQIQKAIAEWPLRVKLADLSTRFDTLGWKRPAEELRQAAQRAADPVLKANAINEALAFATMAARAEQLAQEMDRQNTILAATGDPVLQGLTAYYRARVVDADSIKALNEKLAGVIQNLKAKVNLVQADWTGRIAHDRFLTESFVKDFRGPVTGDVVARWENEVQEYYFVTGAEDVRQAGNWAAKLRACDERLAAIAEEERAASDRPRGEAIGARLRPQVEGMRRRVQELVAAPLVRKDLPTARRSVEALAVAVQQLDGELSNALLLVRPDAVGWLSRVRAIRIGPAGSALALEWSERSNRLIGVVTAAGLTRDPAGFRSLRDRHRQLEVFFTGLAGEHGLAALPVFEGADLSPEIRRDLRVAGDQRREEAATRLLKLVNWEDDVPRGTVESFLISEPAKGVFSELQSALRELEDFGRDLAKVSGLLGQGFALDEGIQSAFEPGRSKPVFSQVAASDSIRGIADQIEELRRLEGETAISVLTAATNSPRLSVSLTAWRRLAGQTAWPAAVELTQAAAVNAAVQSRLEREIRDLNRRTALRNEIAKVSFRQWRATLRSARDNATINAVFSLMDSFAVKEDDLAPRERFNLALWRQKGTDWRALSIAALAAKRDESVRQLRAIPGLTLDEPVQAYLRELEQMPLGEQTAAKVDLSQLGPGSAGWTGTALPDGRSVLYRWRGATEEHQLAFQLVESDKCVPFFLCTTTLPIGLVIDLLAAKPAVRKRCEPWMSACLGGLEDPRTGPQIWLYKADQGLSMNDRWAVQTPELPKPMYPNNLPPPAPPNRHHPLQYIPPGAALYLAREVMGCRLPSPQEWQALDLGAPDQAGVNVRDAMWQREHDYLVAAGVMLDSPIEADIFMPKEVGNIKRGREAAAVAPQVNDGLLWFAEVEKDAQPVFHHLRGNVEEYLSDETGTHFWIAGGSALSPPEVDPAVPYRIDPDPAMANTGFSDVGVRLAFNAPGSLTGRQRFLQLIKNQSYLGW